MDFHSDKIPSIPWQSTNHIQDLFYFGRYNFQHIAPALYLVCGVLFGFWLAIELKKRFY